MSLTAFASSFRVLMPGLIIAGLVALAARWLGDHYTAPIMLFALLLGIAVNFAREDPRCRPGLDFASRTVLRLGVALLGMRITLDQIAGLGAGVVALTTIAVALTILVGFALAKAVKLEGTLGVLMGGATAICGASAALAIAAVLPKGPTHERDAILTVVCVTTLSTIAMVTYPLLAAALGLDDVTAGVFFGATIHDVAQVVGAGGLVSPVAQDSATIMKLFRVALLLPAVLVISFVFRRAQGEHDKASKPPLLPWFLIAFAALVAINSTALTPPELTHFLQAASTWCLVIAIAALGAKTALGELIQVGWRPIAVVTGSTGFVALFVLAGLAAMRLWG